MIKSYEEIIYELAKLLIEEKKSNPSISMADSLSITENIKNSLVIPYPSPNNPRFVHFLNAKFEIPSLSVENICDSLVYALNKLGKDFPYTSPNSYHRDLERIYLDLEANLYELSMLESNLYDLEFRVFVINPRSNGSSMLSVSPSDKMSYEDALTLYNEEKSREQQHVSVELVALLPSTFTSQATLLEFTRNEEIFLPSSKLFLQDHPLFPKEYKFNKKDFLKSL